MLLLRLKGAVALDKPCTDNALSSSTGRREAGAVTSAAMHPIVSQAPRQLHANCSVPQINTRKAMVWQLYLPWQKGQHSWKIQEFLNLLPWPRKMCSLCPTSSISVLFDSHHPSALTMRAAVLVFLQRAEAHGPCPLCTPSLA